MEASRLSFTPETKQAINQVISPAKRKQLRREAVIAYIDSKPAGTPIKNSALINASGIKSEGSGWVFLKHMVDEGFISKIPAEGKLRVNSWAVIRRDTYVKQDEQKRTLTRGEVAIKERRQRFLDFIDAKPEGTPIRTFEFGSLLGITSSGSIANYVNKQVELGYISKTNADGFKSIYTYKVLKRDDMPTIAQDEPADNPTPDTPETPALNETPKADENIAVEIQTQPATLETARGLDMWEIRLKARNFAWEFNSDSLREFIKWISQ